MKTLKEAKQRLLQMHYEAGVGHIGGNLSCLEILFALSEVMKGYDDLIISKGHAAGAAYVLQWAEGRLPIDLSTFHKDGTNLAGHLPNTGSLGHGLGLAAGFALHKKLRKRLGTVFVLMSDGEWDEGSTWEALEFAAANSLYNHMKIIVDCNGWKGFGESQNYNMLKRKMEGYCAGIIVLGDHIIKTGLLGTRRAIYPDNLNFATRSFIYLVRTVKGKGISFLENKLESHYEPLTYEQYTQALLEVEDAQNAG